MKDEILLHYLTKGLAIELSIRTVNGNGVVTYDLCTHMKSHAWLQFKENEIIIHGRYDKETVSLNQDISEVIWDINCFVKNCMCGRDYMNFVWKDILVEAGLWEDD